MKGSMLETGGRVRKKRINRRKPTQKKKKKKGGAVSIGSLGSEKSGRGEIPEDGIRRPKKQGMHDERR